MSHRFSADDVAALLRAASSDWSGATFSEHVRGAFDALATVIPHDTLAAYLIPSPDAPAVPLFSKGIDEASLLDYPRYYRQFDPMAAAFGDPSAPVQTLASCAAKHGVPLRSSVFLNEFLVPRLGIQKILGTNLLIGQEATLAVSVHRRRELPDFSERELLAAKLALPGLARALSVTYAHEDALRRLNETPREPVAESSGVAVFSSEQKLLHATSAARDALRRLEEAGELERLLETVGRVRTKRRRSGRSFADVTAVVKTSSGTITARVFAMSPEGESDEHVHVLLDLLPSRFDVLLRRLAAPYGLTPRELEVLALLHDGATQVGIATQLGVAATTVREHLVHIRQKVGAATNEQILPIMLGLSRRPLHS